MTAIDTRTPRRTAPDATAATGRVGSRWPGRRVGLAFAAATVTGFALASGWLTPRGPVTTGQALTAMAVALSVGTVAGAVTGSRWTVLLAPLGFVAVFELARVGASGPTVDALSGGTFLEWAAFLVGRAVHGLLVFVPLAAGVLLGVDLAARRNHPTARRLRFGGWVATVMLSAAVAVLGFAVARPATTAPIVGPDGEPLAGSIAELASIDVNGSQQALLLRGANAANPVLLHLAGGPGGTDIGAMRLDARLEQRFVVAVWDQPGTGKSYPAFEPPEALTLDRVVDDTVVVTDYLRERFGQDRIYVAGQSWGTLPAALAAQRHPDRFHALIGTGQMVSLRETDQIFHRDALAWAEGTGRDELAARLRALGPPPYDDIFSTYPVLNDADREQHAYPEFDGHTEMLSTIWTPEYTLVEKVNAIRGLADTYASLYPQLQTVDLRETVTRLDVPVYLVMGEHESPGRVTPARTWFDALEAPAKRWVELPASGHRANFERPADYARLLAEVLATHAGD